ncbi:hypothetical protein NOR_03389 [Metarhizium rileyi]|uniref:Uncharacterized protein n=1 Tax=Metarhizium rileyi (strain RCEF 4871) TaxID=1649241 RepID=A0A162LVT8_METRR|nr:hypothetical protein NOR_03389 [Metarhizium rileyi RCEF 4871]
MKLNTWSLAVLPAVLQAIAIREAPPKDCKMEKVGVGETDGVGLAKRTAPDCDTSSSTNGNNVGYGLLSRGQGYNTFLDKGLISNAVILPGGMKKRDDPEGLAQKTVNLTTMNFNFTAPSANLTGLDLQSYFTPPDPDQIIQELLDELAREEDNTTSTLHARGFGQNDCTGSLQAYYKLTEDFGSYLKALDISGAATISGWGQSASVSGNYLNQADLYKEGLTYVAVVDIKKQLTSTSNFQFNKNKYKESTFDRDFGDRWIRARLEFIKKGNADKDTLKANAEASLNFWGVDGDISASVKKSIDDVSRSADVEVSLFYQGDLDSIMGPSKAPHKINASSVEATFAQVKSWADDFIHNACRQNFAYQPLLDEYQNADGFPENQPIQDYRVANLMSYKILKELVRISEWTRWQLGGSNLGDDYRNDIELAEIEMVELSIAWVDSTVSQPKNAIKTGRELLRQFNEGYWDKFNVLPVPSLSEPVDTYAP